jgi:RpiR family carbohydrate utilization transcriptional regulator
MGARTLLAKDRDLTGKPSFGWGAERAYTMPHRLPQPTMLTRIQAQLPHLSKSERRVGDWILANPAAALEQDTRSLARQMDVSQPTLVRFARSLGCEGFQDFRMRLARALGTIGDEPPTTISSIAASPDLESLYHSLFDFTLHALAQVRDSLDAKTLARAIRSLDEASRVTFFGFGNAVNVAHDALRRFMRLEMQVSACTDPHLQALVAAQMRRGDVLVILSQAGRSNDLRQILSTVGAAGVTTMALTTSGSPLQEGAQIPICIDIPDSGDALTPGTAQLAQLLVIDLLAIGVAARRSARIVDTVVGRARSGRSGSASKARPSR